MTTPTLLTVVLNYQTAPMTLRAVATALQAMDGISGEIVVVDNDSRDGSFEVLSAHAEAQGWLKNNRVRVLQSGTNGGFGAGNNFGIRAGLSDGSKPDYVYILNSDAFPAKDAIHKLIAYLENDKTAGLAGSYIHGEDGDTHLTTFRFPSILGEFEGAINFGPVSRLLRNKIVRIETPPTTCTVDWLAGASILIRQNVLDEVGLFDENFFLYFEETDLSRRAKRAGHTTVFVRKSEVAHVGSASTGMKTWDRVPGYWFDSRFYYYTKNHGAIYAAGATIAHLAGGGLHWLRCLLTRKSRNKAPYFLTTMARHDVSALVRMMFSTNQKIPSTTQTITGD